MYEFETETQNVTIDLISFDSGELSHFLISFGDLEESDSPPDWGEIVTDMPTIEDLQDNLESEFDIETGELLDILDYFRSII